MINSNFKHRFYRQYFYIACFIFLPLRLLSSITSTAYAASGTENGEKLSPVSVSASIDSKNINRLELLRADISISQSQNDTKSAEQLKKIIEQIRSVEFKPQKQAPEPVIDPERAAATEPNETVSNGPDIPVQKEQPKQESKPGLPYEPITDQTLDMLRTLAQEPEKLDNPLELGEILFMSGNLKEASLFYQEALKRKDPNDAGSSLNRAWILFQIGNCLREDDPPSAAKSYQRLLTEYPNSSWAQPAKARNDLIAWCLKDEPVKLMLHVKNAKSQQGEN